MKKNRHLNMHSSQISKMNAIEILKKHERCFIEFIEGGLFLSGNSSLDSDLKNTEGELKKRKRKEKKEVKHPQRKKEFLLLKPFKKIKLEDARKIYRRNYLEALKRALEDTFQVSSYFLKSENFTKLCLSYISKYKARSPLLSDYGEKFSDFIRKSFIHHQFPFLADLTFFEWQLKELTLSSFDQWFLKYRELEKNRENKTKHSFLDEEKVSEKDKNRKHTQAIVDYLKVNEDNAVFKMSPQVRSFASSFPIFDLWRVFIKEMEQNKNQEGITNGRKNQRALLSVRNEEFKKDQEDEEKSLNASDFRVYQSLNPVFWRKKQKKEFFLLIKKSTGKTFRDEIFVEKMSVYDNFNLKNFSSFSSLLEVKKKFYKKFSSTPESLSNYTKSLGFLIQKEALVFKKVKSSGR